jgi:hypothetical protein
MGIDLDEAGRGDFLREQWVSSLPELIAKVFTVLAWPLVVWVMGAGPSAAIG